MALSIADTGYVLENGRIVLDGTAERLRDHPDIKDFYLGQTRGADCNRAYVEIDGRPDGAVSADGKVRGQCDGWQL